MNFRKYSLLTFFITLSFLGLVSNNAVAQEGALNDVKVTVQKLVNIAESMPGDAARNARRANLREIISERFDFAEMAKRSLGPQWSKITPEEQADFVVVFSNLLSKTYMNRVEKVTRDMVKVESENLDFPKSVVKSKVTSDGSIFPLDYRLQNVNGTWKVYDVIIENIGLVANYRNEFAGIIRSSGFTGLMDGLRAKSEAQSS